MEWRGVDARGVGGGRAAWVEGGTEGIIGGGPQLNGVTDRGDSLTGRITVLGSHIGAPELGDVAVSFPQLCGTICV